MIYTYTTAEGLPTYSPIDAQAKEDSQLTLRSGTRLASETSSTESNIDRMTEVT